MKTYTKLLTILALAASVPSLFAQLSIPSDGSDGALVISNNTVIDLSQAVTGVWTNNNTANAGKGIYDPSKWAVVFKYSSVSISNGAAVTFINHPTHAPVVWLVANNATINGDLGLDGQNYTTVPADLLPEPGPGGFRGGVLADSPLPAGGGFGPGSGNYVNGDFSSYGNPQLVPLIGGSGGSGNFYNGAAGGGAILIAASGTITVNGNVHANGGSGNGSAAYYGSGGGVRLIANQILGTGSIQAISPINIGRIRLEANASVSASLNINPLTIAVAPVPLVIWPDTNAPTAKIISVASLPAPADPQAKTGGYAAPAGDDLTLTTTNTVAIVVQTANFPTNGTVNVAIKPRNGTQSVLPATFVSGNTNVANWQVTTLMPLSHTVIQVHAVVP